jgi:large repetitive protein
MKRLLTLLSLLVVTLQLSAQTPSAERRPLWVGLDLGGTYQTSDMRPQGGIGWSFTLSRYSRLSKEGACYFGWRFRFLDGRNFGYNYHALPGLQADPLYNNSDPARPTNNYSDSGYLFSNYKMHFDEFAFEFIIGSNRLRKHGVLLYGFGGAGLNLWNTKTDQLDGSQNIYDYSQITTNGDDQAVRDQLFDMRDFTYETSTTDGKIKAGFMPNAGFGFGYQWGNGFALGVEHRTTWALNDRIDGVSHDYQGNATPNNDLYHYDGFFIRWTFGGNSHSSHSNTPPPPPNPNTYTPAPTNTTPPVGTSTTTPTNPSTPTGGGGQSTVQPPYVRFTTPSSDPYTTSVSTQQLVVRVDNVNYSSQIQLVINNAVVNNFSFNPNTHTMVFTHTLIPGNNVYQVTATNSGGTASDNQTIIYKQDVVTTTPAPTQMPPQVTITNPPSDPYTSATQSIGIVATVLNVTTAANIQVRNNGNPVNNFTFNPTTHQVNFTANLVNGNNLFEVIGTNTIGSASDAVTVIYNPAPTIQPPVVTITSPASCPFTTKVQGITISANITNVSAANQVSIVFNNQAITSFNFAAHAGYASITFSVATLNPNSNPFSITGTNAAGTNTKTCDIIYKPSSPPPAPAPVVNITNPATNPYTALSPTMTLYANVLNVASQSEITVSWNNANVTNFAYNASTHVVSYNANLNNGSNVWVVTAANANGSDSKNTTINYNPTPVPPPVVNITSPAMNPHTTTTATQAVTATVLNVSGSSNIHVTGPAGSVNFNYNSSTHVVTFTANLVNGDNLFTVSGTNVAGTASDNVTIKYVAPAGGTTVLPHTSRPTDNPNTGGVGEQTSPTPPGGGGGAQTSGGVSIALVTPSTANYTATSSPFAVTMTVTGATNANEITVRVNNVAVTNFSFNPLNGTLTFNATLTAGVNAVQVTVQNSAGTATQALSITFGTGKTSNPSGGGRGSTTKPKTTTSPGTTTTPPKAETTPAAPGGRGGTTTAPAGGSPAPVNKPR